MDIAQWVGVGSFALGLLSFWQTDDRRLKQCMLGFYVVHALHFILLGSMTSAFASGLSFLRTALAIRYSGQYLCWATILVLALFGGLFATSWIQVFSVIGTSIGTYAIFQLKGISLRLTLCLGASCWLINNILMGSVGGTMLESCLIVLNLTTAYRIHNSKSSSVNKIANDIDTRV
ncbi:YgjV family protein [Vibrio methylphosphonaticus]|uniref:YgjV family protein n=1 Tax=Vibrio methylphosphonaticus TaxID=2946866 RepID=UPI00202A7B72|nr:YgjV family protein [Vibrio methylphosphonaticus]MCL9773988.1 YgjV family protein [Vibrio methylphosphonaticus]